MKKRKTYEVSVINKTYSKTYSDETKFYTSDTALELNFQLKEVEYDFDSAEIILLNVDDRSLVTRPVSKSAEGFTYEIEDDIVEHYGEWKGQLKFNEGGEIYVSSPVSFRIENDLNNDRPPQLTEVTSWKELRKFADKLIADLQIEQDETLGFLENRQDTVESKFDLLQQEMTGKDVISAPEIIAARNGEATLNDRLDKEQQKVTTQLAQTAKKNEVFSMYNMGQDIKEAMTGGSVAVVGKNAVLEENIVPGQITEKTTSFFERGKNLFDVSKVVYDKRIQSGPGTIVDATNYVLSDSIDVSHDAGKKVVFNDKTPLIILAFYTDDAFITAFSGTTTPTTKEAIIIPESATIMRFSLPKGYENNLQLEFGEVSTDYEPFEGYIMRGRFIKGKSIEPEHLSDKVIESLASGGANSYFDLNGKIGAVTATGSTLYESIGILDRKGVEVSVNNGFYIINDKPFSSDFGIGVTFKPKQSTDTPPPTSDTSWRIFHVWQDADNYIECYIASNSGYLVVNYVVGGISHQLVKSGIYANKDETISIYVQFSQNNGIFAHWLQNDVSYLFHAIASIPAPPESMRQVAIGHRLRALTQGGSYFTAVFSDVKIDFENPDGSKYLEGVWTNG